VAFNPAGSLIGVGCRDGSIHLLSSTSNTQNRGGGYPSTWRVTGKLISSSQSVTSVCFSSNGQFLKASSNIEVVIWDVPRQTKLSSSLSPLKGRKMGEREGEEWFSWDSVCGWEVDGIHQWLSNEGDQKSSEHHNNKPMFLLPSPRSNSINPSSKKRRTKDIISSCSRSWGGDLVAVGDSHKRILFFPFPSPTFNPSTLHPLSLHDDYYEPITGHSGVVNSLSFSCDDSMLISSGGADGAIIVWKLK